MPITIDQLDEAHAQVALSILTADANQPVYAGVAPDNVTPPYVLVYTVVEWPDNTDGKSFDGTTSTCVTRWYTHSVGGTDQSTRAIANRVRQLLVNAHPTIAGRSCGFIQQEAALPMVRDETAGSLVQDLAAVYVLTTYPG
jgi:hypothetical protein